MRGHRHRCALRTWERGYPASLRGGRRGRIRRGPTHRLEGPWHRVPVFDSDPGKGCSLPTAEEAGASSLGHVASACVPQADHVATARCARQHVPRRHPDVPPRGDVPPRDVHPRGRDHHRVDLFRGGAHRVQQGCVPFHLGLSWLWISVLDT